MLAAASLVARPSHVFDLRIPEPLGLGRESRGIYRGALELQGLTALATE
jgi:hypothetical protein